MLVAVLEALLEVLLEVVLEVFWGVAGRARGGFAGGAAGCAEARPKPWIWDLVRCPGGEVPGAGLVARAAGWVQGGY